MIIFPADTSTYTSMEDFSDSTSEWHASVRDVRHNNDDFQHDQHSQYGHNPCYRAQPALRHVLVRQAEADDPEGIVGIIQVIHDQLAFKKSYVP